MEMGILQEILNDNNASKWVCNGGMVSPSGSSYVGDLTSTKMVTVSRTILDRKIIEAAKREGTTFQDGVTVESASFDEQEGCWFIGSTSHTGAYTVYYSKVLVAADGATSALARSLGFVLDGPDTFAASTFSENNTHSLTADMIRFYPKDVLPGNLVMSNAPNGILYISCFIGPTEQKSKPKRMMVDLIKNDKWISSSVGPNATLNPIKSKPMRTKRVPKTYSNQFLIIGDAAGHIDPLTREGIHYSMEGGQMAAEVIVAGLRDGDISSKKFIEYEHKWKSKFNREFAFSDWFSGLIESFPIVLEGATRVVNANLMTSWRLVTTGARSSSGWMTALEAFLIQFSQLYYFIANK
eukprot:TRINITY_DN1069_c0_g1_i1.p1 TRINITY_DN1069_c0_g1~~TRINITY_DN1069_c0_g1_i1.p1  ORF type:complete len:353 (-),score=87.20 TRINITY_DN1069_c0_g1_i1:16-1074(-)